MAPEYPPQLVIFDSRFEKDKLKGDLHYVEVPVGHRLRVRWDAEREPENFLSVGGGVAYVFQTEELQVLPISHDSIPDALGDLRYRWSEGLNSGIPWMMFVIILPNGYTLAAAEPKPVRAKVFENRLALYWILKADDLGRAQVTGTLKKFKGNASSKLVELNRVCFGENPPPNASIQIEDRSSTISKVVFISYSHDSDEHRERVLGLSERLRKDGIETLLDQYVNGSPPQGWPRWMLDQLDAADSVLVVCTETYYRRFRGHEVQGQGRGVDWEGALITQEIYDSRSRTLKFVPVFLSGVVERWVPEPLRSGNHYALTSDSAYERLYDFLLGQAGVEPGTVGRLKTKSRRKGNALTFGSERAPARPSTSRKKRTAATKTATKRQTQDAVSSYQHGLRLLANEDYEEALVAFSQSIEQDSTLAMAFYNRGLTHYHRRDNDLAIDDFDRATALGFRDALVFRDRANAYSRKGDVERALADYAQAIALEPENALAYLNRGEVYENTLRKDAAKADYEVVLKLVCDPRFQEDARKRLLAMGVKLPAPSAALTLWQKKLSFLQTEEAKAADAEQKFSIQQRIDEARAKIKDLEADPWAKR